MLIPGLRLPIRPIHHAQTDANATKLWTALGLKDDTALRFPNLRTLKLKLTPVGDQVLNTILEICPDIRRLDVSFTNIQRPAGLIQNTALEKLLLTSTAMSSADMLKVVTGMTALRSLALGALGRKGGSSIAVANTSVMTMTDETLRKLTKALTGCKHLTNVNLAGNTKLGSVSGSALTSFVGQIGRNCEASGVSMYWVHTYDNGCIGSQFVRNTWFALGTPGGAPGRDG